MKADDPDAPASGGRPKDAAVLPANFDPRRHKREERAGYNLIAARYAESAAARTALHAALLDAAALQDGQRVLDLASGPGVLAGAAARRMTAGLVVASDIAEGALAEGRRRAGGDGRLLFAAADAERLAFADAAFDRLLCGLGLMFFPDAARALAEMRRVLKPGGQAVFSVWGAEARVPLVACALRGIRRVLPPPKVERLSPFRFGERETLRRALAGAGLEVDSIAAHSLDCAFAAPLDYWQTFRDLAGGAAQGLARLPQETLARLETELAPELAPWREETGYAMRNEVLLAVARRL